MPAATTTAAYGSTEGWRRLEPSLAVARASIDLPTCEADDPARPPALTMEAPVAGAALPRRRSRSVLAVMASLIVHGAALAWILHQPTVEAIGGGGQDLEAVSVEIVTAAALESLSSHASMAASGSAGPVADVIGIEAPPQPETVAAVAADPEQTAKSDIQPPLPTPDIVAKPDPAPEPEAPLVIAETRPPPMEQPIEIKPEERPDEHRPELPKELMEEKTETPPTPQATASSEAQVAIAKGGAMARASADSRESEAAAGASPGELARYALAVRLALGRARPAHIGSRGKVVVGFRLSAGGSIEAVDIVRSSGSPRLDDIAIAAVRAAAFPTPPAGSTDAQRIYSVPFEFK